MSSHQKYRPYLTMQQIKYFIELAESDNRSETEALKLKSLRELKLFVAKSDLGLVNSALTVVGKQSTAEKLGFSNDGNSNELTPAEQRAKAYQLWSVNPNLCTDEQITMARLFRYENDLMSPDEEAEYESNM